MRPLLPGKVPGTPVFVAHRGASDRALENSPSPFSIAVADGADMAEFDLRLTSDGVPEVFHDERTGWTAKENLEVGGTTAARLRTAILKNGQPIPTLAEVLDLVRGRILVDPKIPHIDYYAGATVVTPNHHEAERPRTCASATTMTRSGPRRSSSTVRAAGGC